MSSRLGGYVLAGSVVLALLSFSSIRAAQDRAHRVVFEVNTSNADQWGAILNNVENLQRAFGPGKVEIEVVAHGNGLGMLLAGSAVEGRVKQLVASRVAFAACENTMRRQKVTRDGLVSGAITVDSGVAELVRKQEAGWAYLKGGE